jgi:predicted TIM-barrel fold metal-dependent hydrolase
MKHRVHRVQAFLTDPEAGRLVRECVNECIAAFGVSRCFFASNSPVDRHQSGASTADVYSFFFDCVKHLGAADKAALFHDNSAKLYRIESLA